MLRITRIIVAFHLLLAVWWLYSLMTFKEGWEIGESFGFFADIGMFAYNIPLLMASFIVKKRSLVRLLFWIAIMPWIIIAFMVVWASFIR